MWFYEEDEAKKVALLLHHITEQYRAAGVSAIKPIGVCQSLPSVAVLAPQLCLVNDACKASAVPDGE